MFFFFSLLKMGPRLGMQKIKKWDLPFFSLGMVRVSAFTHFFFLFLPCPQQQAMPQGRDAQAVSRQLQAELSRFLYDIICMYVCIMYVSIYLSIYV
jgi:hypothetical protein